MRVKIINVFLIIKLILFYGKNLSNSSEIQSNIFEEYDYKVAQQQLMQKANKIFDWRQENQSDTEYLYNLQNHQASEVSQINQSVSFEKGRQLVTYLTNSSTWSRLCKTECIDQGLNFCASRNYQGGACCQPTETCPKNTYCSYDNPNAPSMYKYFVCPNVQACGSSRTITPNYNGSITTTTVNSKTNYLLQDNICSYVVQGPSQMMPYDYLAVQITNIDKVSLYVAKGKQYFWMSYLQSTNVNNNDLFQTTGNWQIYVVGVGNSIFPGTFSILSWVVQGTPPSTQQVTYPAPNLITQTNQQQQNQNNQQQNNNQQSNNQQQNQNTNVNTNQNQNSSVNSSSNQTILNNDQQSQTQQTNKSNSVSGSNQQLQTLGGGQLSNDQSVNYTNIIIGVVVGILLFILAIVFYVWYNLRNRTQDIEQEGTKNESDQIDANDLFKKRGELEKNWDKPDDELSDKSINQDYSKTKLNYESQNKRNLKLNLQNINVNVNVSQTTDGNTERRPPTQQFPEQNGPKGGILGIFKKFFKKDDQSLQELVNGDFRTSGGRELVQIKDSNNQPQDQDNNGSVQGYNFTIKDLDKNSKFQDSKQKKNHIKMNSNDIVIQNTNLVLPETQNGTTGFKDTLPQIQSQKQQNATKKLLNVFHSLDNDINLDADNQNQMPQIQQKQAIVLDCDIDDFAQPIESSNQKLLNDDNAIKKKKKKKKAKKINEDGVKNNMLFEENQFQLEEVDIQKQLNDLDQSYKQKDEQVKVEKQKIVDDFEFEFSKIGQ